MTFSLSGALSLTFDVEQCTNFPQRRCAWDLRKGCLSASTLQMTRRVAGIAREHGARLQFFVLGASLEDARSADLIRELASEGHAIGNHTYYHVNLKSADVPSLQPVYQKRPDLVLRRPSVRDALAWELRETSTAISRITGVTPPLFRSPGGFRNGLADSPDLLRLMADAGFQAVSTQYGFPLDERAQALEDPRDQARRNVRDLQPGRYLDGLLEMPMMGMSDVHAFRNLRLSRQMWAEVLLAGLGEASARKLLFAPIMHPHVLASRDPDARAVRFLLAEAERLDMRVVTLDDLCAYPASQWDRSLHQPHATAP